nr:non-structural polyprotein [Flumine dicistrovirus 43]
MFDFIGTALLNDLEAAEQTKVPREIYDFETAICGIPGEPDFKCLDRTTSAGFPESAKPKVKKGKQDFFGSEGDFQLDTPKALELKAKIEADLLLMKQNIRPEYIFSDNLKDERRKHKKVKTGATRLFSACPLDLLILTRMYFGAFNLSLIKNRIRNGCCVGVNPYSEEWQQLANYMCEYSEPGEKGFGAGDYSAFDASELPQIHNVILDMINAWYNDSHSNIRRILWLEVTNSRHIINNKVYCWPASLGSGHGLTTMINNLYNLIALRYCLYRADDDNMLSVVDFTKIVRAAVYGDDHDFSVREDYRTRFNESTICQFMAEIGLTYTNETKTGVNNELRPLWDITFLKRAFRLDDHINRIVAPLELDTVLEMVLWTKKRQDADKIVHDNVQTALLELSLHPTTTFDAYGPRLVECYQKHYTDPLDYTKRQLLLYKSTKTVAYL